jgi:hypothetical protein
VNCVFARETMKVCVYVRVCNREREAVRREMEKSVREGGGLKGRMERAKQCTKITIENSSLKTLPLPL